MRYLHNDKGLFGDVVSRTANSLGLSPAFVVKDYFIFEMLAAIVGANPAVVFKGGTSLSKCHHAIERFSEDIDLGMGVDRASEGERKRMKAMVVESATKLGLKISNLDETRSRREFNRFVIPLPFMERALLSDMIIVETAVMTPASPSVEREVSSFIGEYLATNGFESLVTAYGLTPFSINVNSLERTYVDKVYALCDYYLSNAGLGRQSRHIYDLYKIQRLISFDQTLADLFAKVGLQRRGVPRCLSAEPDVVLSRVLTEIDNSGAYRSDYENVTSKLLYEDVSCEVARSAFSVAISFLRSFGL